MSAVVKRVAMTGEQKNEGKSEDTKGARHPFAEASRLRVRYTIARRSGQVLGKGTILKIDKARDLHQLLESAKRQRLAEEDDSVRTGRYT
jgi:hypothetical protein